ncbi:unnamed protein product [Prunus armeniaca]
MHGNLVVLNLFLSNHIEAVIGPLPGETQMIWKCTKTKAIFQGLPASSTALKVLFDGWDSWAVYAGVEAKNFMVQTIKDINAQVIEDPSSTKNIGGQAIQAGEVIVTSVITAGDLELPFGDEEDEILAEQPAVEVTPSGRKNKRKETTPAHDSVVQP